ALRLREQQPRPSQEDILALAGNWTLLGDVDFHLQKYSLSRSSYQRAIALQKRLDTAALPLVKDWNGLARIALEEGGLDMAEHYLAKSLAVSRSAEDGQQELAETLLALGKLAVKKVDIKRAQALFEMAWRYLRSTLGDDHPVTVDARTNLAFALYNRGE